METSLYQIAERFVGVREVPGLNDNPLILAMLRLDDEWPEHDEVPWCSAFLNFCAWLLRLPRSKSLAAKSWLNVGTPISILDARVGGDIVIFHRGTNPAHGHVGIFAGVDGTGIMVLGGNQSDAVTIQTYPLSRLAGARRLHLP